jgi:hypothetical protein
MYHHIQDIHHHSEQLDTEEIFSLAAVAEREKRARVVLEKMLQEQPGRDGQAPDASPLVGPQRLSRVL